MNYSKYLESKHIDEFSKNGYTIVRGLFDPKEVEEVSNHFMKMNADMREAIQHNLGDSLENIDPLTLYRRLLQLHRIDKFSRRYLTDPRIHDILVKLMGMEMYGADTMFYFKPPKSRGQALHQDRHYIKCDADTSCAVWIAIDDCDEENGCLRVVPGSQILPILDMVEADTSVSFKKAKVEVPAGMHEVPAILKAGDALIFSGNVIHGSLANVSENRFRRALITQYVPSSSKQIAELFNPVVRPDGSDVFLETVADPESDVAGDF